MNEKNQTNADSLHVLSLEDSDLDFEIISEQLINAGYHLNITRSILENEFISLLCNNTYDIILADYNLPQFDGFEALKICRQYCPDVPFICVSGSIGEIAAIELLKMGAVDYVIKDRLERLPFAIKRALDEAKEKYTRKLIEEELKKKEVNYRTLTENIPDIITRFDKNLRHIYINQAIEKIAGLPPEAFIGKTNQELGMPEEKIATWNENMRYVFETAEPRIFEFDFPTPDGIRHFSSLIVPEFTEDGKVSSILSVARDITEQKLAVIALRKGEERLKDIMFSTMDWVWEVDENGRYTYSSQRDIDLFGFTHDEIIGKTPFDFMPPDEANRVAVIFSEIVANKMPIKDLENWNIGKDGRMICLLTNGVPILDDEGNLKGYRGVDKNITERKNAEQELINAKEKAEASDKLKTAFMNNISHEIRTPLNGILGFTEILTDQNLLPEEKEQYLRMLNASSDRLINTVTNFLDISLLTSGNQKIYKKEIRLEKIMNNTVEKFHDACDNKKLGLTLQLPVLKNDFRIDTDGDLLSKILCHLVDNAVKFTNQGTIEVGCEINKRELHFFVRDSGIGIYEENKKKIFDFFVQENITNTRGFEGSGLGLTIAKGLVDLLGGKIWLDSEKGKGTTFYFSIPCLELSEETTPQNKIHRPEADRKKQTILVVEDDETNLLYINILLSHDLLEVLNAENGVEAVELCQKYPEIQLVLMDLKLHEMDGFEATRQIKLLRNDLPVIAVTAYSGTDEKQKALEAGCDDIITKPLKKELLFQKMVQFGVSINDGGRKYDE